VPSRLLLFAAAGVLLAAAAPCSAQDRAGPWAVTARVGAQQPDHLYSSGSPKLGIGPSIELGVSYSFQPWLEVELAAGWGRSDSPTEYFLVSSDPNDPLAPSVQITLRQQLTTVPLTLGLRLAWPTPLDVRPYAVVGGGAIYGEYLAEAIGTGLSTGWGTEWHTGFGVGSRVGTSLLLGMEARWRWAHATLHQQLAPPLYMSWGATSWEANLGGASLQATVGWAF
jgi:hypothetical protein